MRHLTSCLLAGGLMAGLLPSTASAEEPPPSWTAQVDPLTTALGFVHLQVERALAPNWSIYVGPSLRLFPGLISESDEDFIGLGVEAGVRYFFEANAPIGWWAQVRGVGARLTDDDDTAFGGYVSVLGGYTALFSDRWILAGGLGVQYLSYTINGEGPEGVLPAAHTTVGVAF